LEEPFAEALVLPALPLPLSPENTGSERGSSTSAHVNTRLFLTHYKSTC